MIKALLVYFLSSQAHAVSDTYTHVTTASLATFVGLHLARDVEYKEVKVTSVVLALGILKEFVIDKKADPRDLGANLGGVVVTLFVREF